MHLHFHKYQGTGNDFVMIDNRGKSLEHVLTQAQIARLCDRRFGIGADGLILLSDAKSEGLDFQMIYYNADGREGSMCGNGGRCIVAFADFLGIRQAHYRFLAIDGLHEAYIDDQQLVHLRMLSPTGYELIDNNHFWLNTGSPHFVELTDTPVSELEVKKLGAAVRYSDAYKETGTNVNFVNIISAGKLAVRTYERGVEDETLSCGTGVTACAYVYALWNSRFADIEVQTQGGLLRVEIRQLQQTDEEVWLVGPAVRVFEGELDLN